MISWIILCVTIVYTLGVWLLWRGWQGTPAFEFKQDLAPDRADKVCISVIIPIRNEAANIQNLLKDLLEQDLHISFFEVIVIDDYSTDDTQSRVRDFCINSPLFPLLFAQAKGGENTSNKKTAITQAIQMAKGELIVTTDGDCRVGSKWLSTIYGFYQNSKPHLIIAPVALDYPKDIFGKMQVVEFASLIGSGAATLFWGYPTMCNGANLAYTKKIFLEVNGFDGNINILTGDDEFLMQKIRKLYPKQVLFLKSQDAVVRTSAIPSIYDFYQQRKRWASKWRNHKSVHIYLIAIAIFLYHLLNLYAFYLLSEPFANRFIILFHFSLKLCIEFVFLATIHNFLNKGKYLFYILPLQFVYSFYVVLIGILANFGSYKWKGRKSSKLSKLDV
ncbi:MAG: glycosyltransferase [Cytophagales bacterium]|nr:MAG: glycosyltransferase [Cytophagales bacterium]